MLLSLSEINEQTLIEKFSLTCSQPSTDFCVQEHRNFGAADCTLKFFVVSSRFDVVSSRFEKFHIKSLDKQLFPAV